MLDYPETRVFEIHDGDTVPVTVMVDEDGLHITQEDYQDMTDEIKLSWGQVLGLLDIIEKVEGQFDARH